MIAKMPVRNVNWDRTWLSEKNMRDTDVAVWRELGHGSIA
jgi:hypothetical protein